MLFEFGTGGVIGIALHDFFDKDFSVESQQSIPIRHTLVGLTRTPKADIIVGAWQQNLEVNRSAMALVSSHLSPSFFAAIAQVLQGLLQKPLVRHLRFNGCEVGHESARFTSPCSIGLAGDTAPAAQRTRA